MKSLLRREKMPLIVIILLSLVVSGAVSSLIFLELLTPPLWDYFDERNRTGLELATLLALEACESGLDTLMQLRLSDEPSMVETIRNDTLLRIADIDRDLAHMEIIVVNEENEVLRGGEPMVSGLSIFLDLPRKTPEEAVAPAGEPEALIHWRYFPFFRWHLVAYRSGGDVRAPVKMARRVVVSAMICTILVLLGTLLLVFYHYIQRPLDLVVKAARGVPEGVLEPLPVLRNDEIGRLTITFNSMIQSLGENRELIERNMEALQKSLHEKEVLLQEVHHRVRNNLNVIVSLLNLRSDSLSSTEDAVQAFIGSRNRIRSMAMIHEQLYESKDFGNVRMDSYISQLIADLRSSSAAGTELKIEALLDPISLDLVRAVPLGLIMNEALSNAIRHAYPDGNGGAIRILFEHDVSGNLYKLRIEDDGTGIPDVEESFRGLGLTLIRELSAQIDGTLNIDRKRGTSITVQFPAGS